METEVDLQVYDFAKSLSKKDRKSFYQYIAHMLSLFFISGFIFGALSICVMHKC